MPSMQDETRDEGAALVFYGTAYGASVLCSAGKVAYLRSWPFYIEPSPSLVSFGKVSTPKLRLRTKPRPQPEVQLKIDGPAN
jgi:hypothetical protein